jgi:hypothetical protein
MNDTLSPDERVTRLTLLRYVVDGGEPIAGVRPRL